jgi:2-haloacid dehalogenase
MSVVVFDIGNVVLRWAPERVWQGVLPSDAEIDAFLARVGFEAWNRSLDAGRDWDEAVAALSARHPEDAPLIARFQSDWHAALPGEVPGTRRILDALAGQGVALHAITNYSAPRWCETVDRFPFLEQRFGEIVVSGREGVIKPDPEIFARFLARAGLEARDCIFIDDNLVNVATAEALGFDAIRFTTAAALSLALEDRGVLT